MKDEIAFLYCQCCVPWGEDCGGVNEPCQLATYYMHSIWCAFAFVVVLLCGPFHRARCGTQAKYTPRTLAQNGAKMNLRNVMGHQEKCKWCATIQPWGCSRANAVACVKMTQGQTTFVPSHHMRF